MKNIYKILLIAFVAFGFNQSLKAQYCYHTYSTGCSSGDSLSWFQVGSFIHTSGCDTSSKAIAGYDSSGLLLTIPLIRGNAYQVIASVGAGGGASTNMNFAVFIDYNHDGDFDEANEIVIVDNNRTDSLNVFFTVPAYVKAGKTRLRIVTAQSTTVNYLDTTAPCNSSFTNGETEDYTVDIKSPHKDAQVTAILSPFNYSCATPSQTVAVIVRNTGLDTLKNPIIGLKVTGGATGTYTDTLTKNLAYGQQDTLLFTPTINTSAGGVFNLWSYSTLVGDTDKSNDTFSLSALIYSVPATPKVTNGFDCKPNTALTISAISSTAKTKTYWYASSTSDTLLAVGDTFITPKLLASKKYFVESQYELLDTLGTNFVGGRVNNGNMFDVVAKSTVTIDSFDVATTSTTSVVVEIYYKTGTYIGYETSPKAWKLLGSKTVTGAGTSNPTMVKIGNLHLTAGTRYGLYVRYNTNVASYDFGSNHYVGKDMDIITGCSLGGKFSAGTTSIVPVRNWNGRLYYHIKTCPSARVAVNATISKVKNNLKFNSSCIGSPVSFYDSSALGLNSGTITSRNWTFGDPTTGSANKDTGVVTKHTFSGAGTFVVKIVYTTSMGCKDSITKSVSVTKPATAGFKITKSSICLGDSAKFTNTSTGTGTLTYKWDFGDGNSATSTNASNIYVKSGSYKVILSAGSGTCFDYDTQSITVNALPIVKLTAKGCGNDYTATLTPSGGLVNWGDTTTTSTKLNHTYATGGTYLITGFYTDATTGCRGMDTLTITTQAKPKANFFYKDSVCQGTPVMFTNVSIGSTLTYLWSFGDGNSGTTKDSTYSYPSFGVYTVKLVSTNSAGCADSITKTLRIFPNPDATFTYVKKGLHIVVKATDTTQTKYDWNFGDASTGSGFATSHTYAKDGTYKVNLKVESKDNCSDTTSQSVTVIMTSIAQAGNQFGVSTFPNPFKENTTLSYSLTQSENVKISITDIAGKNMGEVYNGRQDAGSHSHQLLANNKVLNAGIYFIKIQIGDATINKQVVILK
ncbi:MAG: PKD domain-containing protein [Bacteroidetes bacterium]|nr:PKD domain-containing protein [Bacteroidota bacterium]